jgi:hypothetical protein
MTLLTKNQVVSTPYGLGKVVGFERFDPSSGRSIELAEQDTPGSNSRVVVQLDVPSMWSLHEHGNPYFARHRVQPVE